MTYSTSAITSISQIPALAASFATANGWSVNTSTVAQPIFTLPKTGASLMFQLTATVSGTTHDLTFSASGSAVPTSTASVRSPRLAPSSGTTPVVPNPIRVHMFTSPAPSETPYLAIVVEYPNNVFRHLYLGSLNKMGTYAGGEVISGCTPITGASPVASLPIRDGIQFLFQGRSDIWANTLCGGVHIDHVDNATPWRKFATGKTATITALLSSGALGGYGDSINNGPFERSEVPHAGVNILNSINLYAPKPVTGDMAFVPLGRPPGIRHVHMKNLDPGDSIEIGAKTWRVFPAICKRSETSMPRALGNYLTLESSQYFGYAYPEN